MRPGLMYYFAGVLCGFVVACGGGGDLVPKTTPVRPGANAPTLARTPLPSQPAAPSGPAPATPASLGATPAPLLTYTVEAGDTPNAIAGKFNVPSDRVDAWVQQLLTMNSTTASSLQIGQVLKLPPGATSGPNASSPQPGPAATAAAPGATPVPGAPMITQLTSPVGRGQEVVLRVHASSNQGCSPTHLLPNGGVSGADGLGPKLTDSSGNVTWSFVIPPNTPVGEGSVRVICAGNVVAAPLVVN